MAGQYQPPDLSRSFLREKPPRSEAPQGMHPSKAVHHRKTIGMEATDAAIHLTDGD